MRTLNRLERFTDPGAKACFAAFLALDPLQQVLVAEEVFRRLGQADDEWPIHSSRVANCIRSLREAAAISGGPLSVDRYEALRAAYPEPGWRPQAVIPRALGGSWDDCLAQACLDAVPDLAIRIASQGPGFTRDELIGSIE